MGIHMDKNLNADNEAFEKATAESLMKFKSKPRVYNNFEFYVSKIRKVRPG